MRDMTTLLSILLLSLFSFSANLYYFIFIIFIKNLISKKMLKRCSSFGRMKDSLMIYGFFEWFELCPVMTA